MTEMLTAEEIGERLRLTGDTIRKWARAGTIPSLKISPKAVRFDFEAVQAALTKQTGTNGQSSITRSGR